MSNRQETYDVGDEENIPPADVLALNDYTAPDEDWDCCSWGRVVGREGREWKGYKNGGKVYLSWPELLRRWGPLKVGMIDPDYQP